MKTRLAAPITTVALACAAAAANAGIALSNTGLSNAATTLTFDEVVLANQSSLTNQYAAYGVTFSGAVYNAQACALPPALLGNCIGNFPTDTPSSGTNPWSIFFASDMAAAAFGFVTNLGTSTIEALLDGNVVGSADLATDASGDDFVNITMLKFNQIRITAGGSNEASLLDNLQFSPAGSVPMSEPATLALVSLSLLGLAGVARRRG